MNKKPQTYEESGVSIDKGDAFASYIAGLKSNAVSREIGGFAGGMEIDISKYKQPMLLSTTDGVGTKLLVAHKLQKFDTIGIDLVAMCVNDLAVCGAQPLNFLDYIACGKINSAVLQDIIKGIVAGCEQADCILAGGETAEMPDVYKTDDFDLAGFCTGIVDKSVQLPKLGQSRAGDPVFGLPSSGVHSNGYSLARKALKDSPLSVWQELLTPTKIYVRELMAFTESGLLNGAAHITGGGLEGNFERAIPKELKARFYWNWKKPEIFDRIATDGPVLEEEMRRVFNMGIGIALTVSKENAQAFMKLAKDKGIELLEIGVLERG